MRYFSPDTQPPYRIRARLDDAVYSEAVRPEFSPQGAYFYIVSCHGDLAGDVGSYELQVYSAAELPGLLRGLRHPTQAKPLWQVTMNAARPDKDYFGIGDVQWEHEHSLLFRGVHARGPRQLYRLDVRTGRLECLTDDRQDVENYRFRAGTVIYKVAIERNLPQKNEYPVASLENAHVFDWLKGTQGWNELFVSYPGERPRLIPGIVNPSSVDGPWSFSISPDGRWAMVEAQARALSGKWRGYAGWEHAHQDVVYANHFARQFELVDLRSGATKPVFDAPLGFAVMPDFAARRSSRQSMTLWSADRRHAILVFTALPLDSDYEERGRTAYIVDYEIQADRWSIIEPVPATPARDPAGLTAAWLTEGNELLITHTDDLGKSAQGTVYELHGDRWMRLRQEPASTQIVRVANGKGSGVEAVPTSKVAERNRKHSGAEPGFDVLVRQGINEPPVLMASDGRHEIALTGDDPALAGIRRATVREIHWTDPDGKPVTGGLMLPRDADRTKPSPLVIQPYNFYRGRFLPDGAAVTAYAAQPLAAQGIAVLQFDLPYIDHGDVHMKSLGNSRLFSARIDAAVGTLVHRGLIDPSRVGLSGFVVSGEAVAYLLTHPGNTRVAAAVLADPDYPTFADYLELGSVAVFPNYTPASFWQDKMRFADIPLELNAERVQAPLLLTRNSNDIRYLTAFVTQTAFHQTRRPIEALVFTNTSGWNLMLPRQREASLAGTVDWFKFWLQEKEEVTPAASARTGKYRRWRKMKVDWKQVRFEESRSAK